MGENQDCNGSCLVNGSEKLRCEKCGKEVSTIVPALGHKDLNHDSICDVCGLRAFTQILGDEIIVEFNSGALGLGTHQYRFVCIDDDYQGTGKMLYMCEMILTHQYMENIHLTIRWHLKIQHLGIS